MKSFQHWTWILNAPPFQHQSRLVERTLRNDLLGFVSDSSPPFLSQPPHLLPKPWQACSHEFDALCQGQCLHQFSLALTRTLYFQEGNHLFLIQLIVSISALSDVVLHHSALMTSSSGNKRLIESLSRLAFLALQLFISCGLCFMNFSNPHSFYCVVVKSCSPWWCLNWSLHLGNNYKR